MTNSFKLLAISAVAVMGAATQAQANVSLKNGNFFIGFIDKYFSGGSEMKIERVYNSKSAFNGKFGFGWGSDYEVFCTISADGSLVMHENGGGAKNRFTPNGRVSEADLSRSIDLITAARAKEGLNKDAMAKYKEQLRNDARFRNDEWERFWAKGLVQAKSLPEGTVLKSTRFSYQTISKVKGGYVRKFDNGKVEMFDDRCRLAKVTDKNQNFVKLSYDKVGNLASIEDNFNRRMHFKFNPQGKVASISTEGGKTATYKYEGSMLVQSTDDDGHTYKYRYSSDGRFNLVEIRYNDNTTLQVGYNPPSQGETVKWQKDQDGTRTEYEYGSENAGLHYWTNVVVKSPEGKVVSRSKYDYTDKIKGDGEHYTYRLLTEIDSDRTETIYNECCGLPLKIVRNGEETTFEYDAVGHVTKKITPNEVTELAYDAKVNKVSKVVRYSKTDKSKKSQSWAQYQYDARGNLVFARNSSNKGVRIVYDTNGRIKALVDQNKRRLEFVYNEHSKPIQIVDPAVGKINVSYTNNGEIKNVSSTGGRKIAMQVTQAFQNLLEIIRPAGVTLSF